MNTKKLIVAALLAASASTASALPGLQVGIVGGTYDNGTETTVTLDPVFTVYALATPTGNLSEADILGKTFYMSFALTPQLSPANAPAALGSFNVNGTDYEVTGDMTYGTPPIEVTTSLQGTDTHDLETHSIFETWFIELPLTFSASFQSTPFDVQTDCIGCNPGQDASDPFNNGVDLSGTGAYYTMFTVDISLLDATSSIHMDLYSEDVAMCGGGPHAGPCVPTDIDVDDNAPYSHDAQGGPGGGGSGGPVTGVPEIDAVAGTGALTLLAGAMALAGERRRRKTS